MKYFMLVWLISFSSLASTEVECTNQLQKYGFGIDQKDISSSCYEVLKSNANPVSIYKDEKIEIIGRLNAIMFKNLDTEKFDITAGEVSTLTNIIALDYKPEFNEVYILEDNTFEIKTYHSHIQGSLSPKRVLRTEQLIGTIDFDIAEEFIYALNAKDNTIYVYNRFASYHRREQYQNLELITSYEGLPENLNSIEIKDQTIIVKYNDSKSELVIPIKN